MWQRPPMKCMYCPIVFLSDSDSDCRTIGRVYFHAVISSHLVPTVYKYLMAFQSVQLVVHKKYTNYRPV